MRVSAGASQQKVLAALRAGERTWDELKAAAELNDDRLGLTLVSLLNDRLIWTAERAGRRVYGLERRTGLVPRGAHQRRRATD